MENVVNDLLNFNGLKIIQCTEYFNFSLDSVLLADFINIKPTTKKIIDLGTGNLPIPLILTTKVSPAVEIYGVEIQKEIYNLALKTLKINNLENRIKVLNMDIKYVFNFFQTDSFDIVVSNPPYFKLNERSILNENEVKAIARHEIKINIEDIIVVSKKILKNKGSLYLVHRTERFIEIITLLKKHNLEPKRVKFIYPKNGLESNLFLIEAVKNGKSMLKIDFPLVVHDENGNYKKHIIEKFGGKNHDTKEL